MNIFQRDGKGVSAGVLLLIAAVLIVGIFLYFKDTTTSQNMMKDNTETVVTSEESKNEDMPKFEEIAEPKATPAVIDNDAMEELDNIILSIDESEDLSDIDY